jgi:DHA2 family multidrug resistance protein
LILIGVLILEVAVMMMARFNAQTGERELFWPLLVRGMGMAFLFVPINAVVLGQFRGVELGQVAGMMNLSRQIGGSVGIAALSTLLQRYNAQNYQNLLPRISLLDLPTQQSLKATAGVMASRLAAEKGMATPLALSVKAIAFRVQRQVFALSTQQLFWTLFFAFGVAIIPLSQLKGAKPATGPVDAH